MLCSFKLRLQCLEAPNSLKFLIYIRLAITMNKAQEKVFEQMMGTDFSKVAFLMVSSSCDGRERFILRTF